MCRRKSASIGMVFQSYAIWPHMNVFQNVSFPLIKGRKKIPKDQIAGKVRAALKLVQLDGLEDRPATDLSGGQQQRVAMARAMVTEAEDLADGRAAEQPRCAAARADARRAKKDHQGRGRDHALCHARSSGGVEPRR